MGGGRGGSPYPLILKKFDCQERNVLVLLEICQELFVIPGF